MKYLCALISVLVISTTVMAAGISPEENNVKQEEWVKVFGLTIEKSSEAISSNYQPSLSTNLEIFTSTNVRNKKVHVIQSSKHIGADSLGFFTSMPRELSIKRSQYLVLLDLATRQASDWDSLVYEMTNDCSAPQQVKRLYFNGKEQTIITNCSGQGEFPELSNGIKMLVKRIENVVNESEL